MTLAIAIAASLLAALACSALSVSATHRGRQALTFVAVLVPLAMTTAILRRHRDASAVETFQVIGQFAPATDTLAIGRGAGADVHVDGIDADSDALLRLIPDRVVNRLRVETGPGMTVVFDGAKPINAAPIGAHSTILLAGKDSVRIDVRTPRWPVSCLVGWESRCQRRVLTVASGPAHVFGKRMTIRLIQTGVSETTLGITSPRFVVFASGRRAYVASADPELVRVNSQPLPNVATISGDSLTIGRGSAAITLRFHVDGSANRRLVLYDEHLASSRWRLEGDGPRRVFAVSANDSGRVALGTLPLIDLAEWPLGPRARAYAGVLDEDGSGWRWSHAGTSTRVAGNAMTLWPSDAAGTLRGHILRLGRTSLAANPMLAISLLWIAGALLLAYSAGASRGAHPALRIGLVGASYTLIAVRTLLAIRVSQAPPMVADATTTLIALLCALPACVVMIERWASLWPAATSDARTRRRRLAVMSSSIAGAPLAAFAASRGNLQIALLTATIVVGATFGLIAVQRVVGSASHKRSAAENPLSMLDAPERADLGLVQLIRAVATLLVLVAFYVELELARRISWPVVAAAHAGIVAGVWWYFELRARIVPRVALRSLVRRAAIPATAMVAVGSIVASEIAPEAGWLRASAASTALVLVACAILLVVCRPLFRPVSGSVYARADVLPPTGFLLAPVAGLALSSVAVVRRFGITLGFALALVAVLVVVRVLTLLWHHDTRQRVRLLFNAEGRRVSGRAILLASLLALTLLAGHSIDLGLLQLLLLVVIVTMTAAAAMLGKRALAAPLLLSAMLTAVWIAALRVTPEQLTAGPVALSTPRIRYAAATAPDALQRQMVFADREHGRQIVSTLIQEWGIRSHAALGRTRGGGLFSLAFSDGAIRAREAVTDNAFSVFVLSEHGFVGGAALLGLYLAIGLVLLAGAIVAAHAFSEVPRALVLTACAALLVVPALYMIGANVGAVALTGQNLPLLGLRSGADAALFCWIITLAIAALPAADRDAARDPQRDDESLAPMRRLRTTIVGIAGAAVAVGLALAWPMWRATHAAVEPTFRLDTFREALDDLAARRMVVVSNGEVALAPSAPRPVRALGSLVESLVQSSNGDPIERSAHCLDRTTWLRVRKDEVDVGDGCTIAMSLSGRVGWLGELAAGARGGDLVMNDGTGSRPVESRRSHARGDVVDEGSATLVVDSVPRAALAFARWRNGEMTRVVAPGVSPVYARLDSLLSRGFRPGSIRPSATVELTLDPGLTTSIQRGLDSACAGVRQCAVTLVNPERGDILALASRVDSNVRVGVFAPLDANFRSHRAASVIKPIIASAVLARYPSLRTLAVEHPRERIQTAAGWRLPGGEIRSPFRGCPTEQRHIVDWSCFLPTSNNLFAITLGFLGAAESGSAGLPALDASAVGPAFSINGRRIVGRPRFHLVDGARRFDDSPLALGLEDLFDAEVGRAIGRYDTTLWAPLVGHGWLELSGAWQRVSPEVPQLPLDDPAFRDLHRLAGFMIGETDNNWSNVALARAVSRIFTGRGVQLRLVRRVGSTELAPVEKPGVEFGPGRNAVLEGMSGVVRGYGTAHTLAAALPGSGFRFIGKTGTLDSEGLRPMSAFMFAAASPGPADLCSVAGVIFVEMPDGAPAAQPAAKELFGKVVARALASQGPWRDARCRATGAPPRPVLAGEPVHSAHVNEDARERGTHDEASDRKPRSAAPSDRRRRHD